MTEETASPLAAFLEPLEELEYFADLQPVTEDGLFERLYVSLDVDDGTPGREYRVEICFVNDVMEAFGDVESPEDAIITQFMLILPFRMPVESFLDTMRLCQVVNRMLPMGAFGVSEQDEAVYLRYCLASESRQVPETVLIEVIQALEHDCREYGPVFEKLAQGQETYAGIIQQFQESGHGIPSVGDPALFGAN